MHLVRLIYPSRCKLCRTGLQQSEHFLCVRCRAESDLLFDGQFAIPGAKQADAALDYQGDVRRAMHAYKFRHQRHYADFFAEMTGDCLSGWLDDWRPEVITFVPLSVTRHMRRGYNQSALVARLIARRFDLPCRKTLRKRLWVRTQSKVSHALRQENVRSAFHVREKSAVAGRRILLIDDVVTTGATAAACAHLLRAAGAEAVFILAMAKTPLHRESALL